jgi:hypothetical protein
MENAEVRVEITAKVTTTITLRDGETVEDLQKRYVDIYLDDWLDGDETLQGFNKQDLGADSWEIKVI